MTRAISVLVTWGVAACGGGDGGGGKQAAPIARVVIEQPSAFLTHVGASTQLTAMALDSNGLPVSTPIAWTSTTPDQVAVDPAGGVLAKEIGSAQIFAEAGGVRSLPSFVLVAEPAPGALLVSDAQVLNVGPPLGLGPDEVPGMGTQYEVTLAGIATPPAAGTVVLPAGLAVVGGKVVATRTEGANLVVTLALAPVYELLDRYDMAWTIDLAPFAEAQAASAPTVGDALTFDPSARASRPAPWKPLECDAALEVSSVTKVFNMTPGVGLELEIFGEKPTAGAPPTYARRAVKGTLSLAGTVSLKFEPGFKAKGSCLLSFPIKVPVGGLLALVVMPQVRVGVGAEASAELVVARGEVGLTGELSATQVLGFECGGAQPDCRSLETSSVQNRLRPVVDVPRVDGMHVVLSAQVFAFIGLDAVFFLALNAPILEAKFGPKQSFDMGQQEDQASNPGYASSYELAAEGVVEPGKALQEGIDAVFAGGPSVTFQGKVSLPISHSPTGTLSVNKAVTGPTQPVEFTVDLDAPTLEYLVLGYNVLGVEIWRKREDQSSFTPLFTMPVSVSGGQARFQHVWVPDEADVGMNDFVALVMTQLDPLIPMEEVRSDSKVQVDVKCFSVGLTRSARTGLSRAAAQCVDSWSGSSYTGTHALIEPKVSCTSNDVTWVLDPMETDELHRHYIGHGTVTYSKVYTDGTQITYEYDPATHAIDPADQTSTAGLNIYVVSPGTGFVVAGGATTVFMTTETTTLNGDPATATSRVVFVSCHWFKGADLGTPLASDGTTISDVSNTVSDVHGYSFSRN
jgi:hypothetical protein